MTFDDGILVIYSVKNLARPGEKPIQGLKEKSKHYYGYDTIGVTRYYEALKADNLIESVVNIPGWHDILANNVCILENKTQYRISMVQPMLNEDNLKIMKLSLERVEEEYAVQT